MYFDRRGQFTTEYLVVIAIALSVIVAFLVYVFIFYSGYASSSNSDQVATAVNSVVQEANYVSSEGLGSKTSFPLTFPSIQALNSYFCGTYIKISSSSYSSIERANTRISGVLPLTPGTYVMYAKYAGAGTVQIGVRGSISYINATYAVNFSSVESGENYAHISYNLSFFDSNYLAAGATAFNVSVYTPSGTILKSVTGTSNSNGIAAGSLNVGTVLAEYIIDVFALQANVFAPSCLSS